MKNKIIRKRILYESGKINKEKEDAIVTADLCIENITHLPLCEISMFYSREINRKSEID